MKKLITMLLVTVALAACSPTGTSKTKQVDETAIVEDSVPADSTVVVEEVDQIIEAL